MRSYLDNSATTRPFDAVVDAMADAMRAGYYNPSSLYRPAIDVENELSRLRRDILRCLPGAAGEVYFTSGGTEANNLALLARRHWRAASAGSSAPRSNIRRYSSPCAA